MNNNLRHFCANGNILDFAKDNIGFLKLEDLLILLANEWRFANEIPWSVLQHSMAVGKAASMLYPGNNLLIQHAYYHDIQEAILRDVPTPFKKYVGPKWYELEDMIQGKLFQALNIHGKLGDEDAEIVHALDKAMMYVEIIQYFGVVEEMLSFEEPPAGEHLVVCTTAFLDVQGLGHLTDDDNYLSPHVLEHFKQIISLSVL